MTGDTLRLGDTVIVKIPGENREWGYNPCSDGTEATVVGFGEIDYGRINNFGHKPGFYVNPCWVKIAIDGKELTISHCFIDLKNESKNREWNADKSQWNADKNKHFLRDLPNTKFWELDRVRTSHESFSKTDLVVVGIKYDQPDPHYTVSLGSGSTTSFHENQLELVERGNVWKFYNNEPLIFADIKEEATFFAKLGHTEELPNPKTSLYSWEKDEVLEAIRTGYVHGFSIAGGFFGGGPSIQGMRFRNEELGKRVAKATLEGFGI